MNSAEQHETIQNTGASAQLLQINNRLEIVIMGTSNYPIVITFSAPMITQFAHFSNLVAPTFPADTA